MRERIIEKQRINERMTIKRIITNETIKKRITEVNKSKNNPNKNEKVRSTNERMYR